MSLVIFHMYIFGVYFAVCAVVPIKNIVINLCCVDFEKKREIFIHSFDDNFVKKS